MVMKNKLVKNHHKGIYYKTRHFLIGSAVFVAGLAVVAIPTYITINSQINASLAKEDEDDDKNNKKEQEEQYLSYSDLEY